MENKGLDAFKRLVRDYDYYDDGIDEERHEEDIEIIEKELKALDIIKNKAVSIAVLIQSTNVEEYNYCKNLLAFDLTQEEYDLLKEVLK